MSLGVARKHDIGALPWHTLAQPHPDDRAVLTSARRLLYDRVACHERSSDPQAGHAQGGRNRWKRRGTADGVRAIGIELVYPAGAQRWPRHLRTAIGEDGELEDHCPLPQFEKRALGKRVLPERIDSGVNPSKVLDQPRIARPIVVHLALTGPQAAR